MSSSTPPPNVDLVLVIDASSSMQPCIDQLRTHLRELIKPMQGHIAKVRFGLVSLSASKSGEGVITFRPRTLVGDWWDATETLYNGRFHQYEFFTEDTDKVVRALEEIDCSGDEHNLLALDIALDHPFGPTGTTKRVVALFSDEKLENGVEGSAGANSEKLDALIEKIHERRIKLFCALPKSIASETLAEADSSEVTYVQGKEGLASVDYKALLGQMGKAISVSALQGGLAEYKPKALFGQDEWVAGSQIWVARDT